MGELYLRNFRAVSANQNHGFVPPKSQFKTGEKIYLKWDCNSESQTLTWSGCKEPIVLSHGENQYTLESGCQQNTVFMLTALGDDKRLLCSTFAITIQNPVLKVNSLTVTEEFKTNQIELKNTDDSKTVCVETLDFSNGVINGVNLSSPDGMWQSLYMHNRAVYYQLDGFILIEPKWGIDTFKINGKKIKLCDTCYYIKGTITLADNANMMVGCIWLQYVSYIKPIKTKG